MATPSSSATTPSPRPRYLQSTGTASSSTIASNGVQSNEEDRERLAQKVTAGAHLGELALSLRARLLYANSKVKSNATNHTLHELDSQQSAGKHTPNGRRVVNYFHDPGSPSTGGQSSRSATRKGPMAPPPPFTASAAQSLFSSVLAPPPAKRARTIHNPDDPPIPAPEKAIEQPHSPVRTTKATRTPDTRGKSKSKSKKAGKEKAAASSSGKGEGKGKGKQRVTEEGSFEAPVVEEREIDMAAAATLTTFLLNQQRSSVSVTAGSPRSSISAGSDPGSTHSFAHYAQSSTRTVAGGTPTPSSSQQRPFTRTTRSTDTPPQSPATSQASPALSQAAARRSSVTQGSGLRPEDVGTPKMTLRDRVDDSDAADMLLLMATSPSPARPSTIRDRDLIDAAAFRALRVGGSGLKGRVLFPSYGGDQGADGSSSSRKLSRETNGSLASISSTDTEPVSPRTLPLMRRERASSQTLSRLSTVQDGPYGDVRHLGVPMLPTVTPATPTDQASSRVEPLVHSSSPHSGRPLGSDHSIPEPPSANQPFLPPQTPNVSFSFSDYMIVSPSPASAMSRSSSTVVPQGGRRLFEDHPLGGSTPPPQLPSSSPFDAGAQ